jgi:hypothetical protein
VAKNRAIWSLGASLLALAACSPSKTEKPEETATGKFAAAEAAAPVNAERNAYFGNLHVHTGNSFDAFTNGTRTTPQDAYDWAQGKEITNSGVGGKIQIATPLDFYMVSDHAEFMGAMMEMANPESAIARSELGKAMVDPDPNKRIQTFAKILNDMSTGNAPAILTDPVLAKTVWADMVKTADSNYKPGKFTTFAGFEWTSNPNSRNLHRVVMFRDTNAVPEAVLSALDSEDPEALWKWMDTQRGRGSTLLAVPHNGNASDGRMFEMTKFDGKPLDSAYNATRAKNEPLYEISQIKGTSEAWPGMSPNDEFADFELWDYTLSAMTEHPKQHKGAYARQALLDGMSEAAAGRGNPFKYGFIGDSDTHNAAGSNEEFNYTGKFAIENEPKHRLDGFPGQPPAQAQQIREFSSGGLAGVWAESNTREAIYDAMLRKETFGTSGTMIKLRFFGGFDYAPNLISAPDFVKTAYAKGVPMGGDLTATATSKAPTFLFQALKDPKSGNLDRVQIVKGWLGADGKQHEKIYDVAWSGDRKPAANGKLPAVGNTVDVKTARYTNSIGATQLSGAWTDPDFKPGERAFYYARVLEIPTPRWSTIDAAKLKVAIPKGLAATIQERAWSSPIWVTPG